MDGAREGVGGLEISLWVGHPPSHPCALRMDGAPTVVVGLEGVDGPPARRCWLFGD